MPEKGKIDYQVLTWGPCVVKMKMTDEFYKVLWEESEASKTEDLLYQHRLAGIIQKEYKLRKLEKVESFISDMVKIYDNVTYEGLDGIIETDVINMNLTTKNIEIFMKNSNEKVQIMSK